MSGRPGGADRGEQVAATPSPRGCYLATLELHELDEACYPIQQAFGEYPYLVGSASKRPDHVA